MLLRVTLAAMLIAATCVVSAEVLFEADGSLTEESDTLRSGEFLQEYTVEAGAGKLVRVHARSDDFPAFIVVLSENGGHFEARAAEKGATAQVEYVTAQDGEVTIGVTTEDPGQQGAFTVGAESWEIPGGIEGMNVLLDEKGTLSEDDRELTEGHWCDIYTCETRKDQAVRVMLTSGDFDANLAVKLTDELIYHADDCRGTDAEIVYVAPADGTITVVATSAVEGQLGSYQLLISSSPVAGYGERPEPQADASGPRLITDEDELGPDSDKIGSGEYSQGYGIPMSKGEALDITLQTEGFRGYLVAVPPGGEQVDAKAEEVGDTVRLTVTAQEEGKLRLFVTTREVGETGTYSLKVETPAEDVATAPEPTDAHQPTEDSEQPAKPGLPRLPEMPRLDGTKLVDLSDPAIRLPAPKPAPGTVEDPDVLAKTLHQMNYIEVEIGGWSEVNEENWLYGPQPPNPPDQWHTSPRYFWLGIDNQFGGGEHFTVPLKWVGNTFKAYFRLPRDKNGSVEVMDVSGVVSPNGDRVEWVTIRTYEQDVYVDPETGEKLLKKRCWQSASLVDLPLMNMFWDAWERSRFTTMAEALKRDLLDERLRYGFYYGYTDMAEAGDHVADMGYLMQEPSRRSQKYIDADEIHTVEYKSTSWAYPERPPTAKVSFEIYGDALEE